MGVSRLRYLQGAEVLVKRLAEHSIEYIISIAGAQVLPIYDVIYRGRVKVELLVPRTEREGVLIAEGYGKNRGWPVCVMSTLGPGVVNEMPGLLSARLSNSPVLSITPSQPLNKYERPPEVFQALDQPSFFHPVAKWSYEVRDSKDLLHSVDRAVCECVGTSPGPVHLDIVFPILFKKSFFKKSPIIKTKLKTPDDGLKIVCEKREFFPEAVAHPKFLMFPGVQGRGFGLPFAIGVKLAEPEASVVLITTSSFLLYGIGSLETAKKYKIGFTALVLLDDKNEFDLRQLVVTLGHCFYDIPAVEAIKSIVYKTKQQCDVIVVKDKKILSAILKELVLLQK